jgi:hypothetical protein
VCVCLICKEVKGAGGGFCANGRLLAAVVSNPVWKKRVLWAIKSIYR